MYYLHVFEHIDKDCRLQTSPLETIKLTYIHTYIYIHKRENHALVVAPQQSKVAMNALKIAGPPGPWELLRCYAF